MLRYLSEKEVKKLNRRLKHYGLKAFDYHEEINYEIDVKSNPVKGEDAPFVFIAEVTELNKNEPLEVVVYPKAIYVDGSAVSHWNQPQFMEKIERAG
jgi:hypothetical protein